MCIRDRYLTDELFPNILLYFLKPNEVYTSNIVVYNQLPSKFAVKVGLYYMAYRFPKRIKAKHVKPKDLKKYQLKEIFELNYYNELQTNWLQRGSAISLKPDFGIRKWSVTETINDELKNVAQLVHSRHRSVFNFAIKRPLQNSYPKICSLHYFFVPLWYLSLIHIWRCRRLLTCRSRWSPYH